MSYGRMQNVIKAQAALAFTGRGTPRVGLVSSLKTTPGEFMAKVRVMPEDVESGWLPIMTAWGGNGWGLFAPPPINAQVLCLFTENDVENGIVCGVLYNDEDQALEVPVGEFWLVHQDGAFLKLQNDGTVTVQDKAGSYAKLNGDGTATIHADTTTIEGDLLVTGDITDNSPGNTVTVKKHRDDYNAHKHGGVTAGAAQTATTDHPAT